MMASPFGQFVNLLDDILGFDQVALLLVIHIVNGLPSFDLLMPLFEPSLIGMGILFFEKGKNLRDDPFAVSDDGEIDPHILTDRGGIDVDVDDLGLRSKGLDLPGHPVIKSGSDGNQEIRLHHRHIGPVGPMHSQHAKGKGMGARETPKAHERHGDGNSQPFGKQGQLLRGIGRDDPASDIEDRPSSTS